MLIKILPAAGLVYNAQALAQGDVAEFDAEDGATLVSRSVGAAVTDRGAWSASPGTPYSINDMVKDSGFYFIAKVNGSTNATSNTTDWQRTNFYTSTPILLRITATVTVQGGSRNALDVIAVNSADAASVVAATKGVVCKYRGNWNATRDYTTADAVYYNGAYYVANADPAVGDVPGVDADWTLVNWLVQFIQGTFVTVSTSSGSSGTSNPLYFDALYLKEEGGTGYRQIRLAAQDGQQTVAVETVTTPAP